MRNRNTTLEPAVPARCDSAGADCSDANMGVAKVTALALSLRQSAVAGSIGIDTTLPRSSSSNLTSFEKWTAHYRITGLHRLHRMLPLFRRAVAANSHGSFLLACAPTDVAHLSVGVCVMLKVSQPQPLAQRRHAC